MTNEGEEAFTSEEIAEAFEELTRAGLLVKTKRMRGGKSVYVTVENATAEELTAARKSKQ